MLKVCQAYDELVFIMSLGKGVSFKVYTEELQGVRESGVWSKVLSRKIWGVYFGKRHIAHE